MNKYQIDKLGSVLLLHQHIVIFLLVDNRQDHPKVCQQANVLWTGVKKWRLRQVLLGRCPHLLQSVMARRQGWHMEFNLVPGNLSANQSTTIFLRSDAVTTLRHASGYILYIRQTSGLTISGPAVCPFIDDTNKMKSAIIL